VPTKVAKTYLYTLRHPGLFAEFYFPKRVEEAPKTEKGHCEVICCAPRFFGL